SQPPTSHEELWDRLKVFLEAVLPVAERCGVALAAHPDDPPLETVRGQPRLVHRHHLYQKLLDLYPSDANQLELCVGTLAEMQDEDLYGTIERYAAQHKVAYVHLRNVTGKVPHYRETFIDDGDVDVKRVLEIFARNDFNGVVIPDHAPQMSCDAPWHAGMAYAMGYIKAKMEEIGVASA
ncbi:MAG: mannonate dehydratase, partial [Trueperaceae bacterium]